MKSRKKYNDGVVRIYQKKSSNTSNIHKLDDMEFIAKLRFDEKTARTSDLEFAAAKSRELSLKVVTPLYNKVNVSHMAVIGMMLYSIYMIDYDKARNEMYIYLEEAGELDD